VNSEFEHVKLGRSPSGPAVFATTHWNVVLAAGNHQSADATAALERLCQTYWYPLYVYIRRRGHSEHDAEDLTQAFFTHVLQRNCFENISPSKGKFRSYLLAALNHFLSDQYDRASAQKRGGGQPTISFQAHTAEQRFQLEPIDRYSPDKAFERRWALALLDQVLARIKDEFNTKGKAAQFQRLSPYLLGSAGHGTYVEAARDLNQSERAVQKSVERMRRRFYALFREEIASTVATPAEIDEELRHLCAVMAEP